MVGARPERTFPALDGLRAVAVFAVLIAHYFPDRSPLNKAFHWGRFGVVLFFVLSGFLITGILLRSRDGIGPLGEGRLQAFKTFYIRRSLRIFPIYYLTIALGVAFAYRPIVNYLAWHLTYTSNLAIAVADHNLSQATHLWSLGVEEQFYLLWPSLVMFTPPRRLALVAKALIAGSFAFDLAGEQFGLSWEQTHLVLPGCMEALGLGSLLAIRCHPEGPETRTAESFAVKALLAGTPIILFAEGFRNAVGIRASEMAPYRLSADLGYSLVSVGALYAATLSGPSIFRAVLSAAPLRFIGQISYGMYLYHLFLIPIGREVARRFDVAPPDRGPEMFFLYTGITIVLASISWFAIERPVNRLKDRFPYAPAGPQDTAAPSPTS